MTAITLDPTLNSLKIKTVQDQSNQNQVVEKIDGLITVYKNGQIERPDIVPRVTCSLPPELGLTCRDTVIDRYTNTWARIYIPNPNHHHHHHHQSTIKLPLLVYFHGGGFCIGSASWSCYHEFLSKLASKANCAILSVNYRLAPEHRLPAPYEDGAKTLKWLSEQRSLATAGNNEPHWLDQCADLSSVFLAGDSAGANIAYNVAIRSSSSSSSSLAIKGLILIQPFFGGEARTRSEIHTAQPPRSALTLAASDAYWRLSLPSGANRDHPWCNPMGKGAASLKFEGLIGQFTSVSRLTFVRSFRIHKASTKQRFCKRYSTMAGDSTGCCSDGTGNAQPILHRTYQVVVAATSDMGIGKDGKLPWKLPGDLKFFKEITTTTIDPSKKNAVIMGRKTWESIPPQFRPLPGRLNVVLTRSGSSKDAAGENVLSCGSLQSALKSLAGHPYSSSIEKIFLIGGGQILKEALNAQECDAIHITEINTPIQCDTFIPPIDMSIYQPWYSSTLIEENGIEYRFVTYVQMKSSNGGPINSGHEMNCNGGTSNSKKSKLFNFSFLPKVIFEKHEEFLYLKLVQDIISSGNKKDDRTGTGTLSIFGCQMRFNLRKSFPLLTTKRVFWRGVVEELLWFISGSTNAKILQEKGIHIWDGNASREYLDSIGLTDREEGDLGPVYGFQWRHFGAKYTNMHADYTGQGFDQLLDVIDKIKNKPDDRRIIISAWNPSDLKLMALPPCHMFAQFYVANGELSCQMYQRSADMGLGVPFNIASYSLLTCMIAHVCGLVPGDFVHVIGDAHVYKNHVKPLQEQLQKLPRPFPILKINPHKKEIDSFVASDFELINYEPHQKIEMKMAV